MYVLGTCILGFAFRFFSCLHSFSHSIFFSKRFWYIIIGSVVHALYFHEIFLYQLNRFLCLSTVSSKFHCIPTWVLLVHIVLTIDEVWLLIHSICVEQGSVGGNCP